MLPHLATLCCVKIHSPFNPSSHIFSANKIFGLSIYLKSKFLLLLMLQGGKSEYISNKKSYNCLIKGNWILDSYIFGPVDDNEYFLFSGNSSVRN